MSMTTSKPLTLDSSIEPGAQILHWDRHFFLSGDTSANLAEEVIDVTGRARYLVFGPYAPMEQGPWRAIVSLDLCADAARTRLALQFGVEPDYTTVDLDFGVAGPHVVRIDHFVHTAGLGQVRIWLKKAAFHGAIRFSGATVQRLGGDAFARQTAEGENG